MHLSVAQAATEDLNISFNEIYELIQRGRYDEAILKAAKERPDVTGSPSALYLLGLAQTRTGSKQKAINTFEGCIDLGLNLIEDPFELHCSLALLSLYIQGGELGKASFIYDHLKSRELSNEVRRQIKFFQALSLLNRGKRAAALATLESLILEPNPDQFIIALYVIWSRGDVSGQIAPQMLKESLATSKSDTPSFIKKIALAILLIDEDQETAKNLLGEALRLTYVDCPELYSHKTAFQHDPLFSETFEELKKRTLAEVREQFFSYVAENHNEWLSDQITRPAKVSVLDAFRPADSSNFAYLKVFVSDSRGITALDTRVNNPVRKNGTNYSRHIGSTGLFPHATKEGALLLWLRVPLTIGNNVITLSAITINGVPAPEQFIQSIERSPGTVSVHCLAVGIERYRTKEVKQVSSAFNDSLAVKRALESLSEEVSVDLKTDETATKQDIRQWLEADHKNAKLLIVYLRGLESPLERDGILDWAFVPYDGLPDVGSSLISRRDFADWSQQSSVQTIFLIDTPPAIGSILRGKTVFELFLIPRKYELVTQTSVQTPNAGRKSALFLHDHPPILGEGSVSTEQDNSPLALALVDAVRYRETSTSHSEETLSLYQLLQRVQDYHVRYIKGNSLLETMIRSFTWTLPSGLKSPEFSISWLVNLHRVIEPLIHSPDPQTKELAMEAIRETNTFSSRTSLVKDRLLLLNYLLFQRQTHSSEALIDWSASR